MVRPNPHSRLREGRNNYATAQCRSKAAFSYNCHHWGQSDSHGRWYKGYSVIAMVGPWASDSVPLQQALQIKVLLEEGLAFLRLRRRLLVWRAYTNGSLLL